MNDTKSGGLDRSNGGASPKRLRPSGGYRTLRSFQASTIIYDITVSFCERFVDKCSRTVDQMVQEGGYSERLAAARLVQRKRSDRSGNIPACSACGKAMVLRTARKGPNAGSPFWGCSGYPGCNGVCILDASVRSDGSP